MSAAQQRPSTYELWVEAGGDVARYHELLLEHGLLLRPGDDGYEERRRDLVDGIADRCARWAREGEGG